jgi:glycosyltransferase involved in cell wall biosynthesis
MSPEQLEGQSLGPAADIYGLSVVLWEAITGELLVDGESALLVPPHDAHALANALRRIAGDRDLALRLSQAGRRVYTERASEAVLGVRWRELLEDQTGIV